MEVGFIEERCTVQIQTTHPNVVTKPIYTVKTKIIKYFEFFLSIIY
jgi:hypothetical protein